MLNLITSLPQPRILDLPLLRSLLLGLRSMAAVLILVDIAFATPTCMEIGVIANAVFTCGSLRNDFLIKTLTGS